MFILGIISACMRNRPTTECNRRKVQADHQKCRSTYYFMSRFVCAKAFVRLVGISPDKLYALAKHYKTNGPVPRQLRAGGRKNNTASLALVDTERVVHFIKQYAEDHAVSLPGRVPGFKRDDIRLLPSSCPKSQAYHLYEASANTAGHRVVAASTFKKLWLELCPFIVVARPVTDLCWRCQQNSTNIYRSANLTLEEKGELLQEHAAHLSQVDAERQFYKRQVEESKECVRRNGLVALQPTPANSQDLAMHYSFDFTQQVHYPSNAAQPGPMYFMTARKCAVFGVCCEGFPKQVNYLVDECVNCSKGSNGVISYLHHFFESFGVGEKTVHLHCDNCSGQNKNRYVLWYFLWRVMRGLHTEVTMNFMPAGHTKFAPYWCFGLLKRHFRQVEISCLNDLCDVVTESTPVAKVNIPQLVGREDGTVHVNTYNWQTYLAPVFNPLQGIKKIAHFQFSADDPGEVFYKANLAEEESRLNFLKSRDAFGELGAMPNIIPAPGLPQEQQQYLFSQIREFVQEDQRDVVCPNPGN